VGKTPTWLPGNGLPDGGRNGCKLTQPPAVPRNPAPLLLILGVHKTIGQPHATIIGSV
jgi:hypothetical protein